MKRYPVEASNEIRTMLAKRLEQSVINTAAQSLGWPLIFPDPARVAHRIRQNDTAASFRQ